MSSETRPCQNCNKDFIIEPDDFNFYEKIKVPPPTFCPECRNERRMSYRNERSLSKRICDFCKKDIVSMYSDPVFSVYCKDCWWSDKWDSIDYGIDFNFSKTFFEQYIELLHQVPLLTLSILNSINSEYTNYVDFNKNCYLVFGCGYNENLKYANKSMSCRDSQDLLACTKCELSYESIECTESSRLMWSRNSKNCIDSSLLYNCKGCSNCFGCANLINKSYCIWNKQYTKEEYFKELEILKVGSYKKIEELKNIFLNTIYITAPHRFANIILSVDCTGNNIINSKNAKNCFDALQNLEDSKYQYTSIDSKDLWDCNGMYKNELSYESVDCDVGSKNFYSITTYSSNNNNYLINCHNCKNCFGCYGLRSKQYCILNRQYTKEEYEELIPKIIKHMSDMPYIDSKGRVYKYGEFFPSELSPFCYNETIAQEYFPLTKEEALEQGYKWKDKEERNYKIDIHTEDIPDSINDIQDDITTKIIECSHKGTCNQQCTEAFKIIPEELQFYKRMNLPIPRLCPNCRHYERLSQRNPMKLWLRGCMKEGCTNTFETSYSPDRPEIVYCEKCYQQEVY